MRHELRVEVTQHGPRQAFLYKGNTYVGIITWTEEVLHDGMTVTMEFGSPQPDELRDQLKDVSKRVRGLESRSVSSCGHLVSHRVELVALREAVEELDNRFGEHATLNAAEFAGLGQRLKKLEDDA